MLSKKYRLRYLPLFYEDLEDKVIYIAEKLKNPKAANDLLDKVETAILERLSVAESIDDDPEDLIMEVRRFLYHGQNQEEMV